MKQPPISPVGTPDELRAINPDLLGDYHVCAPGGAGLKPCRFYHKCRFAQARPGVYGAFRDKGPRNLGIRKTEQETGTVRKMIVPCFIAMGDLELNRYAEQTGRSTQVLAEEGMPFKTWTRVPVEPNFASNVSGNRRIKTEHWEGVIPKFPRPGEEGSAIGSESLELREEMDEVRTQQEMEDETLVIEKMQKRGPGRPRKDAIPEPS